MLGNPLVYIVARLNSEHFVSFFSTDPTGARFSYQLSPRRYSSVTLHTFASDCTLSPFLLIRPRHALATTTCQLSPGNLSYLVLLSSSPLLLFLGQYSMLFLHQHQHTTTFLLLFSKAPPRMGCLDLMVNMVIMVTLRSTGWLSTNNQGFRTLPKNKYEEGHAAF